jgi:hypothetical protein
MFNLSFETDNTAFAESMSAELARILREVADLIVMRDLNEFLEAGGGQLCVVRDSNGHEIGSVQLG